MASVQRGDELRTSSGPMTSESTPSILLTSARQRMVRKALSVWARVR